MGDTIAGAVIALVSACVGYAMGVARPYLDRWVSKRMQKPPQGGTTI